MRNHDHDSDPVTTTVTTNGIDLRVTTFGPLDGHPIVALHGWPHTSELWHPVGQILGRSGFRVIAPDLRGVGGSERPDTGYDAATIATDVFGVMDALGVPAATMVGIDAGVTPAFFAALTSADRVRHLIVMEGLLPGLPGAEEFLAAGPPWWFGFHTVPGLAERVVAGNEASYLGWFLEGPSVCNDIGERSRAAFIEAYTGTAALRAGFEYYRCAPRNIELVGAALETTRLTVPILALAGGVVGEAIAGQLAAIADDLTTATIPDCGHIIPLERPVELAAAITRFATP